MRPREAPQRGLVLTMSLTPPEQEEAILKKVRAAEKKLRQIQDLKELRAGGKQLEEAQLTKLRNETTTSTHVFMCNMTCGGLGPSARCFSESEPPIARPL